MTKTERIRALLNKTVANGCTPGEQAAAVAKARELITKNGLKASSFTFPPEPKAKTAPKAKRARKSAAKQGVKGPTRNDRVIEMLRRSEGVTLAQMIKEFGILSHTARAYLSVAPRKIGKRAVLDRATGIYRLH